MELASAEEAAVRQATLDFYQALDTLLLSKGTDPMNEIWVHGSYVTTLHPFGRWARGWDEVWATWMEVAAVFAHYHGHDERSDGIGTIHHLEVAVLGEAAYGIGVYKSTLYLPREVKLLAVNCTNVLQKQDGVWKIVHHHPEQAPPDYQAALQSMLDSPGR